MRHLRFHLAELILAAVFIGVFAGLAMRTWGDLFFLHGLAFAGVFLFFSYLLIAIMLQHREARKGDRGNRT